VLDGVKVAFLLETNAVCATPLGIVWSQETTDLSSTAMTCGEVESVMRRGTGVG
jgi:hypothetical protein